MESPIKTYPPWNSLPTAFLRSQTASSLRDSSCTSDDVSDISLGTTNTAITNFSSTLPDLGIPIPHTPKQHYKFQSSVHSLGGADFGYESDDSGIEGAEHVEFSEHVQRFPEDSLQGDDIFAFEDYTYDPIDSEISPYDPCDTESDFDEMDDIDEALDGYVDELDLDDSHISFENSVRFDTDVSYIDSIDLPEDVIDDAHDDVEEQPQMTLHEMMLLADRRHGHGIDDNHNDAEDDSLSGETSIANIIIQQLAKDYPRDMLEVDKQLFLAFLNGIHGDTRRKYQSFLHDRVKGFREGRFQSPFFENETDSSGSLFLDEALKHVIGMFRHIVVREEFDELVHLAQSSKMQQVSASPHRQSSNFIDKIERLLSERLFEDTVSVGKDELSFFADGVVYVLEHPSIYAYDVTAVSSHDDEITTKFPMESEACE